MTIYLDESGYTGQDLLNSEQPIFLGASTNLPDDVAASLVRSAFLTYALANSSIPNCASVNVARTKSFGYFAASVSAPATLP